MALIALLTGLFIGLQVTLAGVDGRIAGDALFEASLRTVILLAVGLVLTMRQRVDDGPIARGRTLLVVGLGVAHGVFAQGLFWNPWWGQGAAPLGVPVVNTLMIAFLAPAVLLVFTGLRRKPSDGWSRAWVVTGLVCAFVWALLALRHVFQDAAMGEAGVGRAEVCAYAVLALLTARLFAWRRFNRDPDLSEALRRAAVPVAWIALAVAAVAFGVLASPWWGPQTTPLTSTPHALLLFGLYALGAAATASLRGLPEPLPRVATAGVVGILFVLLTLLIRWVFHGVAMGGAAPGGSLETWTYSALWAVFGLGVLMLGAGRRDVVLRWAGLAVLLGTAVKVLLFDLAQLQGITRAASFLAVGVLFLAGALAARRLNTRLRPEPDPVEQEPS